MIKNILALTTGIVMMVVGSFVLSPSASAQEGPVIQAMTISALTIARGEVNGGQSNQGTVTLASSAPFQRAVTLTSSDSYATVQSPVVIPAGQRSGSFTITTGFPLGPVVPTIYASYNGFARGATFTICPPQGCVAVLASSLTFNSSVVTGGQNTTATVRLTGPAPPGGAQINLASSDTHAIVPSSVIINAGQMSATFQVMTAVPLGIVVPTVHANYVGLGGGSVRGGAFTICPAQGC